MSARSSQQRRASTRYTFLRWDDVTRGLWAQGNAALWRKLWTWVGDLLAKSGEVSLCFAPGPRPATGRCLAPPLVVGWLLGATTVGMILAAWSEGMVVVRAFGGPGWAGLLLAIVPPLLLPRPRGAQLMGRGACVLALQPRSFGFIAHASRGRSCGAHENVRKRSPRKLSPPVRTTSQRRGCRRRP